MKCMHPKCKSDKPAAWQPTILLWPNRPGGQYFEPSHVQCKNVYVCEECTKSSRPMDYVASDGQLKKIMKAFRGRDFQPNWFTAKLSFMIPETIKLDGDRI